MNNIIERKDSFDCLAKRILYGLKFSYSDFEPLCGLKCNSEFKPVKYELIGKDPQRKLHEFLFRFIELIEDDPSKLNLPITADDSLAPHVCFNQKPEFTKPYQNICNELFSFYKFLFYAGLAGKYENGIMTVPAEELKNLKITVKPCYIALLKEAGIDCVKTKNELTFKYSEPEIFPAWKALSEISNNFNNDKYVSLYVNLFNFATCNYNCDYTYWLRRVEKLNNLPEYFLDEIKKEYLSKGYTKSAQGAISKTGFGVSCTFRNKVSGFNIEYISTRTDQFSFSTLNGKGVKAMLEDFNNLDIDLQDYLMKVCGRCRNCLGCTKGGKSKKFAIDVNYKGEAFSICPMFPESGNLTINNEKMNLLMKFHDAQNIYGTEK